jgi:hypothetical protein
MLRISGDRLGIPYVSDERSVKNDRRPVSTVDAQLSSWEARAGNFWGPSSLLDRAEA